MRVKLKDPTRVYYDSEQKVTLIGSKVFTGIKVTQFIRSQLNTGALVEVAEPVNSAKTVDPKLKARAMAKAQKVEVS